MATEQKWEAPGALQTYLSTELNSLADSGYYLGAKIDNVADGENEMFMAVELTLADQGGVRGSDAHIKIFLLPSINDTDFCYGQSDGDPAPPAHTVASRMPLDVSTPGRVVTDWDIPLPPFDFKLVLQNSTGQAFGSSGNTLKYRLYSLESQ